MGAQLIVGPLCAGGSRTAGTGTEQRMAHINDSHLGLRSCPFGCLSRLAVMEPGTGGWWQMERRDGRDFTFEGRVGVREAGEPREKRGRATCWLARSVEMGRGAVCSCLMP